MEKPILKKLNELEYHYKLLEEEVKMNYDTRNILNLIHETRSLVEKLTIPNVVKSFYCHTKMCQQDGSRQCIECALFELNKEQ